MSIIADTADSVFRDYATDGVPASGAHRPIKSEVRDLFGLIDTGIGYVNAVADGVTAADADIAAADVAAAGEMLRFRSGAYRVAANLTITSPVSIDPGTTFVVDSGATLTFNGRCQLPFASVFTGAGSAAFRADAIDAALPEWWGAQGNNDTDIVTGPITAALNATALQAALNAHRVVDLKGRDTYRFDTRLAINNDGQSIIGRGRKNTRLLYTGTVGAIWHPLQLTTTRTFFKMRGLQVSAPNLNTTSRVVDLMSVQFWSLDDVWITGATVGGVTALWLGAVWITTEGTYGSLKDIYIGLCGIGIRWDDDANHITCDNVRVQCSLTSGFAYLMLGNGTGRISGNWLERVAAEFPGQINTGAFLSTGVDGVFISGRWESLATGINIGSAAGNVSAPIRKQLFSSNTSNISTALGTGNATAGVPSLIAGGQYDGAANTTSWHHNLTMTRTATGSFTFTFVSTQPSNRYLVSCGSNAKRLQVTGQNSNSFTVETRDASDVLTNYALMTISVFAVER